MSVLIKGMKMPESCHQCVAGYGGFCFVCSAEDDGVCPDHGRPEWCPLVELPAEHGRLGDLDAMAFDESEAYMSAQAKLGRDVITTGINSIVHRKIQLLIMDTPTIIESEVSK